MLNHVRPKSDLNKLAIFIGASAFFTLIIVGKLFYLQIVNHDHFQARALAAQQGLTEILPQHGTIIIKDHHSDSEFPIATNTTLNLVYADPGLIQDPTFVTSQVGPLLFDLEEAQQEDQLRINKLQENIADLAAEYTPEEIEEKLRPLSDQELQDEFMRDFELKISQKKRPEILLANDLEEKVLSHISSLQLPGVEVIKNEVYAYPPRIVNPQIIAESLAPALEIPTQQLERILQGENRYVVLKRKVLPEVSEQITAMINADTEDKFLGLAMKEEYFRYYPEQSLAANIIGFVGGSGNGNYGIEQTFNKLLKGEKGRLETKQDSVGRQITVGESKLKEAVDGANIVLTLDRSVQIKVEEIMKNAVERYDAKSGQAVVMDPQTGAVLAMVNYPTFNPNEFGAVFKRKEIFLTEEEIDELVETPRENEFYHYVNEVTLERYSVFREKDENGATRYYRYDNFQGPEVYQNKSVSLPYEPGSVFKSIAMAIAIDAGEISPNTTYNDVGPVGVGFNVYTQDYDFEIKNSNNKYYGLINMKKVLGESLNTGMTYIANKIGPKLFYKYIEKFGFLEGSGIEFDSELTGQVKHFEEWNDANLATYSFGQGLTVNMVQLANAYGALANGGILMQPYIVDEIRHDNGKIVKTEPRELRRVISEETSDTMTAMLRESVEVGVADTAQLSTHYVAGKTGTSQTYKHGKALVGEGTTIATFAGYGPVDNPEFVILVKFDQPKTSQWGSTTAAPTFKEISEFLFNYYNIPPDKV
jgi:cell division protein FtsI/penicillin-binding protein 2